jgi:hypothetical protein
VGRIQQWIEQQPGEWILINTTQALVECGLKSQMQSRFEK